MTVLTCPEGVTVAEGLDPDLVKVEYGGVVEVVGQLDVMKQETTEGEAVAGLPVVAGLAHHGHLAPTCTSPRRQ